MQAADALRPIPLTIVTGFLGAGKTTLVNALLADAAMAETLVIVNEFGEIGLDHDLIEAATYDMVLLSAGCLCCTVRGDLISTLEDLLRRRDNNRIRIFRRVLVETTGLADPAPILHVAIQHPYLAKRFALQGLVTAVDAANGAATLDAHAEAVKQVAVADRLVLTKLDLAPAEALKARLRALNPTALILSRDEALADVPNLIDCGLYDPATKAPDVLRWLSAEGGAPDHHHHDHHHDHDHDHHHAHGGQNPHDVNRHDASIRAFSFVTDEPIPSSGLTVFQEALRVLHGANLLRLKGIVRLADDPSRPVVLHAVQHVYHPPISLPEWPSEDRRSRLVVIARNLDETVIAGLWQALARRAA